MSVNEIYTAAEVAEVEDSGEKFRPSTTINLHADRAFNSGDLPGAFMGNFNDAPEVSDSRTLEAWLKVEQ